MKINFKQASGHRPANTKAKGANSQYGYHDQRTKDVVNGVQKRRRTVRTIHKQFLMTDEGLEPCAIYVTQDSARIEKFYARKIERTFDESQGCYWDKPVTTRMEAEHLHHEFWKLSTANETVFNSVDVPDLRLSWNDKEAPKDQGTLRKEVEGLFIVPSIDKMKV